MLDASHLEPERRLNVDMGGPGNMPSLEVDLLFLWGVGALEVKSVVLLPELVKFEGLCSMFFPLYGIYQRLIAFISHPRAKPSQLTVRV